MLLKKNLLDDYISSARFQTRPLVSFLSFNILFYFIFKTIKVIEIVIALKVRDIVIAIEI
jgi:hypothetical protein